MLKNNRLETGVQIKPTNSMQYLHFNSSSLPCPHLSQTVNNQNTSSVNNGTMLEITYRPPREALSAPNLLTQYHHNLQELQTLPKLAHPILTASAETERISRRAPR